MSELRRAWVLNLDAEHELEGGTRYTPSRHLHSIVRRERGHLLERLLRPGDVLVTEEDLKSLGTDERHPAHGLPGFAWSPTPRARSLLLAAGARPVAASSLEVLQRVNARPFAAEVRGPLADGSFGKQVLVDLDQALEAIARPAPDGWLVRRTFGAAGRGRRRVAAGKLSPDELSWLRASLRKGPLVLEPWVQVTREYTRSGWVTPQGQVDLSAPCIQETTRSGAWSGSVATSTSGSAAGIDREDDARLEEAFARAGEALAAAGYHGPFGIDAFRHRLGDREVLNPLSEINARFTMDWTVGMQDGLRPHSALGALENAAHERAVPTTERV